MWREDNKDIEKMEKILKSIHIEDIPSEEIEKYKNEFKAHLNENFEKVTSQKGRIRVFKMNFAYGIVAVVLILFAFSFVYTRPYFVKLAVAKVIENKLGYKVSLKDIIVNDGVGIVIYNLDEITVDVLNKSIETNSPIQYELSNEEKEKAVEIFRNSREAKNFVLNPGTPPQDVSKNDILSVKGLLFPKSNKKLIEVITTAYNAPEEGNQSHRNAACVRTYVRFLIDIDRGTIQY